MIQELKHTYEFDMVHDAQQVFRQLLDALARPGEKKSIQKEAGKFGESYAPLTAIGCTLLDQEKVMYVEKNPRLSDTLHDLTFSHPGTLSAADYLFLSSAMNYASVLEVMKHAKKGTYANPQESATLIFLCETLDGEKEAILEGPGIHGTLRLKTSLYIYNLLHIRQKLKTEYPLGIDFYCVTPGGELLGFPRLVRLMGQKGGES